MSSGPLKVFFLAFYLHFDIEMPMISLQVDEQLAADFDQLQKKLGFASRSEALRESIIYFIRQNQQELPSYIHRIASLTIHHEPREDVMDLFTDITQKHAPIIKAINQYNLKNRIIKNLIVAGSSDEINDFHKDFLGSPYFKTSITYLILPDSVVNRQDEEKK